MWGRNCYDCPVRKGKRLKGRKCLFYEKDEVELMTPGGKIKTNFWGAIDYLVDEKGMDFEKAVQLTGICPNSVPIPIDYMIAIEVIMFAFEHGVIWPNKSILQHNNVFVIILSQAQMLLEKYQKKAQIQASISENVKNAPDQNRTRLGSRYHFR